MHALEFTGEQDAGREFQHRNDELLYVADGAAEVEAEGRAYRLDRGDTLYLSGGCATAGAPPNPAPGSWSWPWGSTWRRRRNDGPGDSGRTAANDRGIPEARR